MGDNLPVVDLGTGRTASGQLIQDCKIAGYSRDYHVRYLCSRYC